MPRISDSVVRLPAAVSAQRMTRAQFYKKLVSNIIMGNDPSQPFVRELKGPPKNLKLTKVFQEGDTIGTRIYKSKQHKGKLFIERRTMKIIWLKVDERKAIEFVRKLP